MRCDKKHMLLYAVTDRAWIGTQTLYQQVEAALKGGATCVQLREKELDEAAFLQEAKELCALCRRYGVPFIVNDNVDVAQACGADGVHVGQEDMKAGEVRRRVGEDMILGVSVHTVEEARRAVRDGADYLGLGAVFPTSTKTDADQMSNETLRDICGAVEIPVVAIGGLNRDNILRLSGSGVDGVALVSAIFGAEDIEADEFRDPAISDAEGEKLSRKDFEDRIEWGKYRWPYGPVSRSIYRNWDDFEKMILEIYTEECFWELNGMNAVEDVRDINAITDLNNLNRECKKRVSFLNVNGRLYTSKGYNVGTHEWVEEEYELMEQTEDRVFFYRVCTYQ